MLKIRIALAKLFRTLFKINFVKSKYFGFYRRIFRPLNLFKGVVLKVKFIDLIIILQLDDWLQSNIYFFGEYEKAELKTLDYFLHDKSVFIDIGANIGLYSLYASRLIGDNGKIISFEPFQKNYKSLSNNISINNLLNVQLENLAVGKEDSHIDLYYDAKEMNLGMVSTNYIENAYCEKIKVITLDSYFKNKSIKRIDFIKIDIEGHEYEALLGMRSLLQKFYPTLLIEILSDIGSFKNEKKIENYLKEFGYRKYFINDDGSFSNIKTNTFRENHIFTTTLL